MSKKVYFCKQELKTMSIQKPYHRFYRPFVGDKMVRLQNYGYVSVRDYAEQEWFLKFDFLSLSMEKSKMLHQDFRKNVEKEDFSRKSCIFATELIKT